MDVLLPCKTNASGPIHLSKFYNRIVTDVLKRKTAAKTCRLLMRAILARSSSPSPRVILPVQFDRRVLSRCTARSRRCSCNAENTLVDVFGRGNAPFAMQPGTEVPRRVCQVVFVRRTRTPWNDVEAARSCGGTDSWNVAAVGVGHALICRHVRRSAESGPLALAIIYL